MAHKNRKDYTGMRFGSLVALSDTGKSRRRMSVWLFRCDCGRQCERIASEVNQEAIAGHNPRCNQCHKDAINITGRVYGSLTALRKITHHGRQGALWEFRCVCGRLVHKLARDVRYQAREGNIPSCGRVECGAGHNATRDYTGEQFGKLTVIKRLSDQKWLFQCSCGIAVTRSMSDVMKSVRCGYEPACKDCNAANKQQVMSTDYTGQRFGNLIALCPTEHFRGSSRMWLFRCNCGVEVERVPTDVWSIVKRGQRAACPDCRQPSRKLPGDIAIIHRIRHRYEIGARNRGLQFSLTEEDVRSLVTSNCFYCGAEPSRQFKRGPKSNSLLVNGIDRMHNHVGYERGNVVSCCWVCNRNKRDMPYEEWIAWIDRIAKHRAGG